MLYKYPQRAFPYSQLIEENRRRGKDQREYELLDTGLFDDDRYFDVFAEYAKAAPDDVLMQVTVHNRGPEDAELHLLPQLWFRNTWSWKPGAPKPLIRVAAPGVLVAAHAELGTSHLHVEGDAELLFCDNETNRRRLFGEAGAAGYFKDAFHEHVIHGRRDAVNPQQTGTKAAAQHRLRVPAGGSARRGCGWRRSASPSPSPTSTPSSRNVSERRTSSTRTCSTTWPTPTPATSSGRRWPG